MEGAYLLSKFAEISLLPSNNIFLKAKIVGFTKSSNTQRESSTKASERKTERYASKLEKIQAEAKR